MDVLDIYAAINFREHKHSRIKEWAFIPSYIRLGTALLLCLFWWAFHRSGKDQVVCAIMYIALPITIHEWVTAFLILRWIPPFISDILQDIGYVMMMSSYFLFLTNMTIIFHILFKSIQNAKPYILGRNLLPSVFVVCVSLATFAHLGLVYNKDPRPIHSFLIFLLHYMTLSLAFGLVLTVFMALLRSFCCRSRIPCGGIVDACAMKWTIHQMRWITLFTAFTIIPIIPSAVLSATRLINTTLAWSLLFNYRTSRFDYSKWNKKDLLDVDIDDDYYTYVNYHTLFHILFLLNAIVWIPQFRLSLLSMIRRHPRCASVCSGLNDESCANCKQLQYPGYPVQGQFSSTTSTNYIISNTVTNTTNYNIQPSGMEPTCCSCGNQLTNQAQSNNPRQTHQSIAPTAPPNAQTTPTDYRLDPEALQAANYQSNIYPVLFDSGNPNHPPAPSPPPPYYTNNDFGTLPSYHTASTLSTSATGVTTTVPLTLQIPEDQPPCPDSPSLTQRHIPTLQTYHPQVPTSSHNCGTATLQRPCFVTGSQNNEQGWNRGFGIPTAMTTALSAVTNKVEETIGNFMYGGQIPDKFRRPFTGKKW